MSVQALVDRILTRADDIGAPGPDVYSNHGRLSVYRSIVQQ